MVAVLAELDDQPFADFINGVQKYVATSHGLANEWTNAAAIEGSVTDFVRDLKSGTGADIGVHGSITLAQSLLAAGLVDEVRLARRTGGGRQWAAALRGWWLRLPARARAQPRAPARGSVDDLPSPLLSTSYPSGSVSRLGLGGVGLRAQPEPLPRPGGSGRGLLA